MKAARIRMGGGGTETGNGALVGAMAACLLCLMAVSSPAAGPAAPGTASSLRGAPLLPPPPEAVSWFGLDPFYRKHASVSGLPIVGSERVKDTAVMEAAHIIGRMLAGEKGRRIIGAMISNKMRVAVMAVSEATTDIPEHRDLTPADYWDRRARGLGATRGRPAVSCGEENLLNFGRDRYEGENILIHEFAHGIHEMALRYSDTTFEPALGAAYDKAMKAGLWKGTYASVNENEYWAEGVQSWFHANIGQPGHVPGADQRASLIAYDPDLGALLAKVFESSWRYRPYFRRAPETYVLEGTAHRYDSTLYPPFPLTDSPNSAVEMDPADKAALRILLDANGYFSTEPDAVAGKNRAGRVTSLNLAGRRLSVLPPQIGNLAALKRLNLYECGLNVLPAEIGRLTALNMLILSRNNLTFLPREIASMTSLGELIMDNNRLETLPESLVGLRQLWFLMANDNRLTGLPARLGELTGLTILSLENNQLASLPASMAALNPTGHLLLDGNTLCSLPLEMDAWISTYSFNPDWRRTQRCAGAARPQRAGGGSFRLVLDAVEGRLTVFPSGRDRILELSVHDLRGRRMEGEVRREGNRATWKGRSHGMRLVRARSEGGTRVWKILL